MRTLFLLLCLSLLPSVAMAATLSLVPADGSLSVILDTDTPINTIGVRLLVSASARVVLSGEGSIISSWIDAPTYDPALHAITLSGIIPNGWSGTGGQVMRLTLTGASGPVTFDPQETHVYKNDGQGSEDSLTLAPGTIKNSSWWDQPLGPVIPAFGLIMLFSLVAYWIVRRTPIHEPTLQY